MAKQQRKKKNEDGPSLEALKAQAHAVLETHLGHNPQLLAAARAQMEEQAVASPDTFKSRMDNSPQGKIRQYRQSEAAIQQYKVLTTALDEPVKKLLAEKAVPVVAGSSSSSFPAVDLAAGSAYITSQFALRYRQPFCAGAFDWIPTDTTDTIERLTRPCLTYLAEEARQHVFLCKDLNGDPIFSNDRVTLQGLKSIKYNGKVGVVLGRDPTTAGRFAVQLGENTKPISFKAQNLVCQQVESNSVDKSCSVEEKHRRFWSQKDLEQSLYEGLLERSSTFDILKREFWPGYRLEELRGRCALVTCTNLLTEIGHKEPGAWKLVMEIASELLFPGGLLLQGDADGWGHFGNVPLIQDYARPLGLVLQTNINLDAWVLFLWRKEN